MFSQWEKWGGGGFIGVQNGLACKEARKQTGEFCVLWAIQILESLLNEKIFFVIEVEHILTI